MAILIQVETSDDVLTYINAKQIVSIVAAGKSFLLTMTTGQFHIMNTPEEIRQSILKEIGIQSREGQADKK